MGRTHAKAYAAMPGVSLAGIVCREPDAAAPFAAACQSRAFGSLEELLAVCDPDIIDVCVPTYLHKQFVQRAASMHKHVICEKPIARRIEDAESMIAACERAGVKLLVGQVVRFFPEYRRARELVQSGAIGRVGTVRTMRGGSFPRAWQDWYASVERSGSLIVDLIIHDIDYLRWCFGDVERVFAKSLSGREVNRVDHVYASVRFVSGVIAHVEGSWAFPSGFHTELEIAGQRGLIRHESRDSAPIHTVFQRPPADQAGTPGVEVPESPLEHDPYYRELAHFLACIEGREDPVITAREALEALRVSLAILESAQTGRPVTVARGSAL